MIHGTIITYTRLLIHFIIDDLTGGVEEGGESSGTLDLFRSMSFTGFVLKDLNNFKGLTSTNFSPGRWSLKAHVHEDFQIIINNIRLDLVVERQQRRNDSGRLVVQGC
jgi:hypothetical protein